MRDCSFVLGTNVITARLSHRCGLKGSPQELLALTPCTETLWPKFTNFVQKVRSQSQAADYLTMFLVNCAISSGFSS